MKPRPRTILVIIGLLLVIAALLLPTSPLRSVAAYACSNFSFTGPANITLGNARAITSGDFNKDGRLDLVVANSGAGGSLSMLLGNGAGGFSQSQINNVMRTPSSIISADLNGDGKLI